MAADARQRIDAGMTPVVEDIRSRFTYPAYEKTAAYARTVEEGGTRPAFRPWRKIRSRPTRCRLCDRDAGRSSRWAGRRGMPPPSDDAIADLADKIFLGEIASSRADISRAHVARPRPAALWRALDKIGVATRTSTVTDIIACPARLLPLATGVRSRSRRVEAAASQS